MPRVTAYVCPGCGGVVGRDCFNPQECEAIREDMARQHHERQEEEREYEEMQWRALHDPTSDAYHTDEAAIARQEAGLT